MSTEHHVHKTVGRELDFSFQNFSKLKSIMQPNKEQVKQILIYLRYVKAASLLYIQSL